MAQTIYYVKPTASGNGSGLGGWQNATSSLPTALSSAQNGDQIWIAAGLYKPTSTTARTERFTINRNLAVYGGFVGTENSPASRTLTGISSTTLSGDIGQVGVASDNSYRVIDMPTNSVIVRLDGLVIRDGTAVPAPDVPQNGVFWNSIGAGLYCRYSSLTLVNCIVTANQSDGLGGGAYLEGVNLNLISSQFTSNTTITGGGGILSIASSVSASGSVFADNIGGFYTPGVGGGGQGGGISLINSSARFDRCTFRNNFGHNGGAISVQNIPATLTNCLLIDNRSPFGAAVFSPNGVSLSNCTISRNQNKDDPGTVVAALLGSGSLTNCLVWGNNTNNQSPFAYSPFTTVNSLVQGIGADPVNGNLDGTDANLTVFVDLANANYALQLGSPTIDAGRTSANATTLDLAEQNRVMGCAIDMGALEFVQSGPLSVSITSASTTVCVGQPITLTTVTQGGSSPFSYTWAVAAAGQIGLPTNASVVSITSTLAGPLSVTVKISTTAGCTALSTSVYTVVGTTVQPLASSVVCVGTTITTIVSATGTISGYQWFKGTTALSGQTSATLTLTNVQPGDTGDYSVQVDTPCNNTLTIPFSLTVQEPVGMASLANNGPLTCAQTSVTLTGTATNATSFTLLNTGQTNATGQFVVSSAGSFTVRASTEPPTSANSCTATSTASSSVGSNTALPGVTLTASSLTFCSGTVTLTAGTGNSYEFSGPGLTQNGSGNTAIVTQGGTFSVVISGINGCTASAGLTITLVSGGVSLGAIPTGGGFCEGTLAQAVVPVTGSPNTLQWYQDGVFVSGQHSATLTLLNVQTVQAGSYVLVATANCNSATSTAYSLTVGTVIPTVTITLPNGSTVVATRLSSRCHRAEMCRCR